MHAILLALSLLFPQQDLAKHVYPLAKSLPCPPVSIDTTDFPEGKAWAEQAKKLVEQYFPIVTSWLSTHDYKPPKEIKLVFKKEQRAPAFASGGTITINGKWITDHPDDLGMVVHELTHVIQAYPPNQHKAGWLVEGIADYIRWWRYEPELHAGPGRTRIDPEKAKWTDSYRTTALFLAWASRKHDMRLVPSLDAALRKADDPLPVFERLTGKKVEELWQEFVASRDK